MRTAIPVLVVLGVGIAGAILYWNHQQVAPAPAAAVQAPAPATTGQTAPVEQAVAPKPALPRNNQEPVTEPPTVATASPAVATGSGQSAIAKAVDALLSAKSGGQKHELFQQLLKAGQIDQAIAELKHRMADNPNDAEIPTTLGEAQINKLKVLHDTGGDYNEIGILALQADQSFNAALRIDPQNWEAQFVKASSMYYWPADPVKDNDVVQRLSGLIDQQDTLPAQPEFARTYEVLGNEFQKIGQPDKALATWQLGAQKFPNDSALQTKINNPPAPQ
jgi:tetratricopeptide (TPR) repeat protein